MSEIVIGLDPQIRLIGLALAASSWPQREQAVLTHAVHPHAKRARQWLQVAKANAAIVSLDEQLANGASLALLYEKGLVDEAWRGQLAGFAAETAVLTNFVPAHEAVWETAVAELRDIVVVDKLADFLHRLCRETAVPPIYIHPNLLYPALTPVLAKTETAWHLLVPPPKAVGESPPWPYAEDPGWVVAQLCAALLPGLLSIPAEPDGWLHALTAVCLGELVDDFEAQAYTLRSKKQHKLPHLPQMVAQVEAYLAGEVTLWELAS
ncbi:MAG: hypothetical protein AAF614_33030 [Chloroflexota bacterium]